MEIILQYFSDFIFLYQVSKGIWIAVGLNDFMYLCSYFTMAYGLILFNSALVKINTTTITTNG